VEDDAVLYLNNLKACWDQLCFDVPRLIVRLRKLGSAGLLTVWVTLRTQIEGEARWL